MKSNMQNENKSGMSWKDRLNDADALHDVKLTDKNAAWEKLHNRMQEQPGRKALWYWLAAAFALVAIILPFNFSKNIILYQPVASVSAKQTFPKSTNVSEKNKLSSVEKKASPVVIKKVASSFNKKIRDNGGNILLAKQTVVINKLNQSETPMFVNLLTDSSAIKSIPPVVTASALAKTKLKVVHVNELGEPIAELNPRTSIDDYSMIQFGIIRQQPPVNTVENKNHSSTFSKQKNTSN